MSNWSETQLTAKGRALDAKVTAGLTTLTFTRMKIGSGNVIPEEIDTMTDLKSPRLVIGISSCEVSEADPTICSVIGVAKSDDVETSFLVKEQGLFATDPDEGEILYAVMLDSEPDKMPNKNVPSPLSIMYQINIVSDNAADITAIIDPAGLVTVQTMNAAINSHDSNATAHGAAISAHNVDTSAHKNLYGFFLRQPSKYYALGTVVYLPSIGAGLYLECTTAGTTDSGDLVISTPKPNDTVTDGTVVWTIKKIGEADISGKANVTLNNLDTNNLSVHVVVDSYHDAEGNWYRKYSDGWVEQGGINIPTGNDYNVAVSFLKAYKDTNYTLLVSAPILDGAASPSNAITATSTVMVMVGGGTNRQTNTGFYLSALYKSNPSGHGGTKWYACGMGADL